MEKNAGCGDALFTRNFILTCFATLLFYMSFHLLLPTLPVYVLGLGGTEGDVGLVMSAFAMASVFMRPFAGQWVDQGHRKGLMLAGAVVYVVSAILYGLVTHVKGLVAVRFLHGLGIGMYSTAASSLISDSVPRHRRGEGLGYFLLATSLAMAVGPVVGVWIVEKLSYFVLFTTSATLAGIVFVCTLSIAVPATGAVPATDCSNLSLSRSRSRSRLRSCSRAERSRPENAGDPGDPGNPGTPGNRGDGNHCANGNHRGNASPGNPVTCRHRRVLASIGSFLGLEALFPSITLGFGSATYGSIASFIAVYARSRGIRNPGIFFTVFALSMFATRTFAGRISDRYGRASVIAPGLAAISFGMATLAGSSSLASFALAAVIYGVGFSVMQPTVTALMVDYVPSGRRGASMGTLMAMYDVGIALGGVAAGWIAERLPLDAVYWCMSGVGACGLVFFLCGYRRYCVTRQSAMTSQGALVGGAGPAGRVGPE
ncbi:MAG: MFS transporter [Bacillota bacterium]